MNKLLGISIIGFSLFGAIMAPALAMADLPDLEVQFERAPLFSELDFLPGDSASRWAKVTNNSGSEQTVAIQAQNVGADSDLASKFSFTVAEGGVTLTNMALDRFLAGSEVELSKLAKNGAMAQYDITITLNRSIDDPKYSDKTMAFDIAIGFAGEQKVPDTKTYGASSGGSGQFSLTIKNVRSANVGFNSADILWDTNVGATSQVVYSKEGEKHSMDDSLPNYGYAASYPKPENGDLADIHAVTLNNLDSCTRYYYAAVSHLYGRPGVSSGEYWFTTQCPRVEGLSRENRGFEADNNLDGRISGSAGNEPEQGGPGIVEGASDENPAAGIINGSGAIQPQDDKAKQASGWDNLSAALMNAFGGNGFGACWNNFPWWLALAFAVYPVWRALRSRKGVKAAATDRLKNYLASSWRWWLASAILPVGLAVWAMIHNPFCFSWLMIAVLLLLTLFGWWYDREQRRKLSSF